MGSGRQFPVPGRPLLLAAQPRATSTACWPACCGWPSTSASPASCSRPTTRARSSSPSTAVTCGTGSCSRIRPRTCRAGWPASTRCTSFAASSACPARVAAHAGLAGGGAGIRLGRRLPADRQAHHAVGRGQRRCAVPRWWPARRTWTTSTGTCARSGAGLMLQEFIPGGPGHDWFFHGYCDADSICQPAFTGVKERSYPAAAGLTSLGRSVRERESPRADHLAARHDWATADCSTSISAWTRATAQYHLLDFNPRLGRAVPGLPRHRGHRRRPGRLPRPDRSGHPAGRAGERACLPGRELRPAQRARQLAPRRPGLRSWLSSLRTVDEAAWFARDDLRPFGLMCLRMGWRMATRPFAGNRRHDPSPRLRYRAGRAASGTAQAPNARPRAPRPQKEETPAMSDTVDVAIIGAGPYGLSLAAHLRAAGVDYRHFGMPMRLWRAPCRRACSSSPRVSPPTCPTPTARTRSRPSAGPRAAPTPATGSRSRWTPSSATASGSSPNAA